MFATVAIRPARSRRIRRLLRRSRPLAPSVVALLALLTALGTAVDHGAVRAADGGAEPARASSHSPGRAEALAADGDIAAAPLVDPGALAPTADVTPTEALVLARAIEPLRGAYPHCPLTVEASGSSATYRCNAAAGHFFSLAVDAFASDLDARARFEALREDRAIAGFHGFVSAAWEYDEQPNAMRNRYMYWQAQRWVFSATAFDDTIYNIAADPTEMAERMHEAAQAVGLLASAVPVGGWDVQHLDVRAGAVSAVTAHGDRAYVGVGQSLEIVDFADPANPRTLGSRTLSDLARDIVLGDGFVVVAEGDAAFEIVDVSDPTTPMPSSYGIVPARGVALSDGLVAVAGGSAEACGLRLFDLAMPAFLDPVAYVRTPGDALAVATVPGRTALVADGDGGLRIVDISVPQQARELAALPMNALDVAVSSSGRYAYVAAGDAGLIVVDATDPAAPAIAGTFATGRGQTIGVEIDGDVAYASLEYGDVVAIDVSTPDAPVGIGTIAATRDLHGCDGTTYALTERATHLAIASSRAYAASWENGLRVIDVATPAAPVEIGAYASPFTCAMDVRIAGDLAYVAADRDGLRILGWRSGRHLAEIGAVAGITATMLAVGEGYVYAADNHGLWIVDVRDPAAPTIAGSMQPFGRWIDDLDVVDDHLFVAAAGMEGSLVVVDVGDPAHPAVVGTWATDRPLWRVEASGHHAYVLDGSTIYVIDVADPDKLIRVGRLTLPGMEVELELAGDKLYLAHAEGMLHVVDIADRTHPRLVGAHRAPRLATLAVSGDTALLSGDVESAVLSVARPADPRSRLSSSVTSNTRASGIAADGEMVLFARGARGLLVQWIGPFSSPDEVGQRREFVGQIGGATEAAAIDGHVAYVGIGPRLAALDVSDPAHPVLLGETRAFADVVQDVALRGRTAIVAAGRAGIRIVDVADPDVPREIGSVASPGATREAVVVGDLAYVADVVSGLAIIDVAEPTDPRLLATIGDAGARSVAVGDGYAYILADTLSEVQVYDIRVPTSPRRVGTEMFLGGGSRLALAGHHLFVAALDSGLLVLDVAEPATPVRTGWLACRAVDVAVRGDRAYVVGEEWLSVVDVASPAEPRLLGTWRTPGEGAAVVVDAAGRAVVSDRAAGLRVVDATDPAAPHEIGSYRRGGAAHNVVAAGPLAYVASREGGLDIVGLGYPRDPTLFAHLDVTALDVVVQGTQAYVGGTDRLTLVNVSEPTAPRPIASVPLPGATTDLLVSAGYAFVTVGNAGLAIIDVSDLNALRLAGTIDTAGEARAVALNGAYAYVADGAAGLRVIDVTEPAAPREVGSVAELVGASGVTVLGRHAYVSTQMLEPEPSVVAALDLTDPTAPRVVGTIGSSGEPAGLVASGNTVFVATGRMGVSAVDASDPVAPGELGRYDVPGLARGVFVVAEYVLVAADEGGLYVLERGVPRATVASTLYLPTAAR